MIIANEYIPMAERPPERPPLNPELQARLGGMQAKVKAMLPWLNKNHVSIEWKGGTLEVVSDLMEYARNMDQATITSLGNNVDELYERALRENEGASSLLPLKKS